MKHHFPSRKIQIHVANILLFNFCEQKFVLHGTITIVIVFFRRKMAQLCLWAKIRTKQWLVLGASGFQCMRALFCAPNATILLAYIPAKIKMSVV